MERKDAVVEIILWTLTSSDAALVFVHRHRRWAPVIALVVGFVLVRCADKPKNGTTREQNTDGGG